MSIPKAIINLTKNDPTEISKDTFFSELIAFKGNKKKKRKMKKEIFDLAWDSRKFEIELYWKRAGYYWAFQALVFVGYFSIIGLENIDKNTKFEYMFIANSIGIITSLGWYLINKGSKSWQRHWEKIIDLLEDEVIGKLYKTGTEKITFSVSKINELISLSFTILWSGLAINQLIKFHINPEEKLNLPILLSFIFTILICISMYFGKGRGRFGERTIKLYRRNIKTN